MRASSLVTEGRVHTSLRPGEATRGVLDRSTRPAHSTSGQPPFVAPSNRARNEEQPWPFSKIVINVCHGEWAPLLSLMAALSLSVPPAASTSG